MKLTGSLKIIALVAAVASLASCGNRNSGEEVERLHPTGAEIGATTGRPDERSRSEDGQTIWDIFRSDNSDVTVRVNKYIWNASLEVLDFLPVQSVDPFSGVIVTGYGTPPGGGRSYRATVYVRDPSLDARSLHVAMQTRGGRAVSAGTVRAVEDAILTRARQLRVADGKL
ncbi:DUF3576 domain-containing protein [Pelagimonas sp. KU-00592-HH]|uniref:DUF3576 domain-containing protein n=1 Tax=Pelagimonas sp. KU-00592-HH TaxID=3127651 RepID=UPI00310AB5DF